MTEDQSQFHKASLTCHCNLPFDFWLSRSLSGKKNPPANPGNAGDTGSIPGQEDPLEG